MSYQSDNLDLEILEEGDPADLTTVSDNFDKIDAVAGDIATIETSPTQSSHAAGEFLLYEGRLYKVTSAISAGGSLVLGTNVSAANIGDELQSLQDSMSLNSISTVGSSITMLRAGYLQIGKLVIVNAVFRAMTAVDGDYGLFTVPASYQANAPLVLLKSGSTNPISANCRIYNAYVRPGTTLEAGKEYVVEGSYMIP